MDSHTLFFEFKRLITKNKKAYFGFVAGLFGLLLLGLTLPALLNYFGEGKNGADPAGQAASNPAIFEMYIEYETGSSFTNTLLLEEAMKSDAFIAGAEQETGIEISDLLDQEAATNYPKTARDRGVLGASRDEASNIWVFSSKVGTEAENLAVITYFYDRFANNEVPLLENKSRYIMSEPRVLTDEELQSPTAMVEQDTTGVFTVKDLVLSAVLAMLGAVVLAFAAILLRTFFTKKIQYAFNYSWSEQDLFVLTNKQNPAAFKQVAETPLEAAKLYLAQAPALLPQTDLAVAPSALQANQTVPVDEIVIFVQPDVTEKTWYNEQRELLKVYRKPIKVVQVND